MERLETTALDAQSCTKSTVNAYIDSDYLKEKTAVVKKKD